MRMELSGFTLGKKILGSMNLVNTSEDIIHLRPLSSNLLLAPVRRGQGSLHVWYEGMWIVRNAFSERAERLFHQFDDANKEDARVICLYSYCLGEK